MAKYANGWIGVVRNNLDQIQNTLNMLKRKVAEANRNPDDFSLIVIIYPSINTMNTEVGKRLAFTGTMEQVGNDIDSLIRWVLDILF